MKSLNQLFCSVVRGQWSLAGRYRMPDTGCRIPDAGYQILSLFTFHLSLVLVILLAFTASNLQGQNTHIISHLDEKLPESGNIVYCSSFEHAWKELADSVLHDEVKLQKPISLQGNLNRSYKTAAYSPNSIHDSRILPAGRQSTTHGDSIIVTSSFQEQLEWPVEFQSFGHPMRFYTGPEEYTRCEYFGIHLGEQEDLLKYNQQVRVVDFADENEFIVKLDARIQTHASGHRSQVTDHEFGRKEMSLRFIASRTEYGWVEIIIAKVPRKKTLLKIIENVEDRIKNTTYSYHELIPDDILAIPKINLDISKEYGELLGKYLANKGFEEYFFAIANQNINFSMDEQGARAGSDVTIMLTKGPSARRMVIDGPFLIYLKEYGSDRPYFAAWIDNTEYLVVSSEY